VNKDDVDAVQHGVEIEGVEPVVAPDDVRKGRAERGERRRPMLGKKVPAAPAVLRLVDADLVAAAPQLADNTAEEMGVPVIPVRNDRVIEEGEAHGRLQVAYKTGTAVVSVSRSAPGRRPVTISS